MGIQAEPATARPGDQAFPVDSMVPVRSDNPLQWSLFPAGSQQRIFTMSLIKELKRRNIFRVAILYIAFIWLLLQLAEVLISMAGSGDWVYRFMLGLGVICFPLMLIFSYLYEITPEGLRKEHLVAREESITRRTGQKIARATWLVIAIALLLELLIWLMI